MAQGDLAVPAHEQAMLTVEETGIESAARREEAGAANVPAGTVTDRTCRDGDDELKGGDHILVFCTSDAEEQVRDFFLRELSEPVE